jgi:hypothetical protein
MDPQIVTVQTYIYMNYNQKTCIVPSYKRRLPHTMSTLERIAITGKKPNGQTASPLFRDAAKNYWKKKQKIDL